MAIYPTTEEVKDNLLSEEEFKIMNTWGTEVIKITRLWKISIWNYIKDNENEDRLRAIAELIIQINNEIDEKNEVTILFHTKESQHKFSSMSSCYSPNTKEIHLKGNQSIITALHELGHHIFGSNELKACVFSISLFKIVFPKAYTRLKWNNHILTK